MTYEKFTASGRCLRCGGQGYEEPVIGRHVSVLICMLCGSEEYLERNLVDLSAIRDQPDAPLLGRRVRRSEHEARTP